MQAGGTGWEMENWVTVTLRQSSGQALGGTGGGLRRGRPPRRPGALRASSRRGGRRQPETRACPEPFDYAQDRPAEGRGGEGEKGGWGDGEILSLSPCLLVSPPGSMPLAIIISHSRLVAPMTLHGLMALSVETRACPEPCPFTPPFTPFRAWFSLSCGQAQGASSERSRRAVEGTKR